MLNDGLIYDSARLPQNAVQEHPITVSAESIMHSMGAMPARGHPITFSGGSILDSQGSLSDQARLGQSAQGHPISFSGSILASDSHLTSQRQSSQQNLPALQYYPVTVSDPSNLIGNADEGKRTICLQSS